MKKTYVTSMPNHIGAFLKASKCFSQLGINITRVSYNKAVDSHTLFIDSEGTEEQLKKADIELEKIGYFQYFLRHSVFLFSVLRGNDNLSRNVCPNGYFSRYFLVEKQI